MRRTERSNIPRVAVREAIVNAVAHADYAQRGAPIQAIYRGRIRD
jgi:ATP-dependent DNA helicase RecG